MDLDGFIFTLTVTGLKEPFILLFYTFKRKDADQIMGRMGTWANNQPLLHVKQDIKEF